MCSKSMANGVMEANATVGLRSVKQAHLGRLSFANHQAEMG